MVLYPGTQVDEFQIIQSIGRGGFGEVFLAYDFSNSRKVAIKQYRPISSFSKEGIHRFLQEAKIIESLHDPNIVSFYGLRKWGENYYILMEFVEGGSLRDLINQGKKFTIDEVVYIGKGVSQALMKVQELGVIHRDIKPENILLTLQGIPKLSDFGLSWMATETGGYLFNEYGQKLGTLPYMSPEQIIGGPISRLTDIHAVGTVLYELLAGKPWIDIVELEHQAKLLAPVGTIKYCNVLQDLITDAIVNPKEVDLEKIRDDVPSWLSHVISNAINQLVTIRGIYLGLNRGDPSYEKYFEQSYPKSEKEFIEILTLTLRPPFDIPNKIHSLLIFQSWKIVDNLNVYLVMDSKDALNYVDKTTLSHYSIDTEEAFHFALQNLEIETELLTPKIITNDQGKPIAAFYESKGENEASRILLPSARQALCRSLHVDVCFAAVPESNLFIACIPDREYLQTFVSQIRKQYITRPHPVSNLIFQIDIHGNINQIL